MKAGWVEREKNKEKREKEGKEGPVSANQEEILLWFSRVQLPDATSIKCLKTIFWCDDVFWLRDFTSVVRWLWFCPFSHQKDHAHFQLLHQEPNKTKTSNLHWDCEYVFTLTFLQYLLYIYLTCGGEVNEAKAGRPPMKNVGPLHWTHKQVTSELDQPRQNV